MTGLPCKVAIVLVLVLSGTAADLVYKCEDPKSPVVDQTPEKCDYKFDTGSHMSNEERQSVVNAVNLWRAFIANQCGAFKSGVPKSANFRKIRYSCDLEQSVKFECPPPVFTFKTEDSIFRQIHYNYSTSIFYRLAPWIDTISINNETQDYDDPSVMYSDTLRFYLNGDAPEIGCYLKICHEKRFIACTTQTDIPTSGPLYTPGTRCQNNTDCNDPGYPVCDMELGLCQQGKLPYQCVNKTPLPLVRQVKEVCFDSLDTESLMSNFERQTIVDALNLHRGYITNQCDAFRNGKPKSANMLKISYSCKLEHQVKFECPAAGEQFKSDKMVLRSVQNPFYDNSRTSILWRLLPYLKSVAIDPDTQILKYSGIQDLFLAFALNNNATEVGCFVKMCPTGEHVACTTGHSFDLSKPLYTPGNRCQSDADCKVVGYHSCDKEYGLCKRGGCLNDRHCTSPSAPVCNRYTGQCGPIVCKFSEPSLTVDPCADLRYCSLSSYERSEKHFCQSTVIIATRTDGTFFVKGFGAAVSRYHLLTSYTSEFDKHGKTDLFLIVGGTRIVQLRDHDILPEMHIGRWDFYAWQDLVLVKLPSTSSFDFITYFRVRKVGYDTQNESHTVRLSASRLDVQSVSLQPDAECDKIFDDTQRYVYVGNSNMACGLDEYDKGTLFLSGAPMGFVSLTDGKHTLYGIRSDASRNSHNGFLVTKLAPNCDWLSKVSDGAVKCIYML